MDLALVSLKLRAVSKMNPPMNLYTVSVLTFSQVINEKLAQWTTRPFLDLLLFTKQWAFCTPFYTITSPRGGWK